MLLSAANNDVTTMSIQKGECKQFMDNVGVSIGTGPNQVVRAYDGHQSQMPHAKEFDQILLNRKAVQ